jgi:hypothetical protein
MRNSFLVNVRDVSRTKGDANFLKIEGKEGTARPSPGTASPGIPGRGARAAVIKKSEHQAHWRVT